MSYLGFKYDSKGGDDAKERQLRKLQEVARSNGLLGPQQESAIPAGVKSAFARVADLLQRPNFAIAGMVDVLQGTGRAGETVGGRVARELFSGISGLSGDKEAFGQVLEQGGVGEGGRLSDLFGVEEGFRFDPTLRGTVGLAMDIFLDPTTYLTAGVGNAVRIVGRGGKVKHLTKAGKEVAEGNYRQVVKDMGRRLGTDLDRSFHDIEQAVWKGLRDKGVAKSAGQAAEVHIKRLLKKRADDLTIEAIEGGAKGLATERAIRFDLGALGSKSLVSTRKLSAPVRAVYGQLTGMLDKTARGQAFMKNIGKAIDSVDKLFNTIPRQARRLEAYRAYREQRNNIYGGATARASTEVRRIMGRWAHEKTSAEWNEALSRFLDNPSQDTFARWSSEARKAGMSTEEAVDLAQSLRGAYRTMGVYEMRAGVIDNVIENYSPHRANNFPDNFESLGIPVSRAFRGADVGRSAQQRVARTYDELDEIQRMSGVDFGVEYDPRKLLQERFEDHFKAMGDAEFTQDMLRSFGLNEVQHVSRILDVVTPHTREYLEGLAKGTTDLEARTLGEVIERSIPILGRKEARASVIDAIDKEFRGRPESEHIEALADALSHLVDDIADATNMKNISQHVRAKQALDVGMRRAEIFDNMANRSDLVAQIKDFRKTLASLKRAKSVTKAATSPEVQKAKGQLDEMLEAFKGMDEVDADVLSDGMKQLIARQRNALKLARMSLNISKDKKLRSLDPLIDDFTKAIDELDSSRIAVNKQIDFLRDARKLAEEDLARADNLLGIDRDRLGVLGAEATLNRALIKQLKKQRGNKLAQKDVLAMDVQRLIKMRPEMRAAFMMESLAKATSIQHMGRILDAYGDVFDSIAPQYLADIRKAMSPEELRGLRYADQPYVNHAITKGPLKGTWSLPKGIAEDLERFKGQWQQTPEFHAALRGFDKLTNTFKLWVTTPFPAFHARNAYSNIAASAVDIGLAALDPRRHSESLRIMLGADGTLKTATGRHFTFDAIRNQLEALGIVIPRSAIAELETTTGAFGQGALEKLDKIMRRKVASTFDTAFVENEARALHYITLLRRGMSPEDAATQIKKFLFDYADLTTFERNVMRRFIPFYTWQSKNIRRQAANLVTRPGRLGAQVKVIDQDRGPDGDMLPEYLRGDLQIRLNQKPGKKAAFITNIDLPISNVDILWKGGLGKTFRENLSLMNPWFKTPVELATGMELFSGRSLRGHQFMGQMGPAMDRNLPGWMKDAFQLRKIERSDGSVSYTANATRVYLTMKSMFVGRLVNTAVTVDELARDFGDGKPNYSGLMKLLSGLQFREYDFEEAQRNEIENKVDRLEELLLSHGLAAEFSKVFIPDREQ